MIRSWIRLAVVAAGLVGLALSYSGPATVSAVPFTPTLSIFASNPAPSANSNLRIATSLSQGNIPLGTWSLFMPAGWEVAADSQVEDYDVVVRGTMSVDTDCDGSINTYGPFNLLDDPVEQGGEAPVAEWLGEINPWWDLLITVDQSPSEPFDLSADLTAITQAHTFCAPQTFILTILGRSSPTNDVVLTNPSAAQTHTFTGSYLSMGGAYGENVNAGVCVGNSCDGDGDGVADVSDNCDTWPNQGQALPPWIIATDDPDCDGFSSIVEDAAGTLALIQCGFNAWPGDVGNDTFSDISDVTVLAGEFGASAPPAPARYNIAPNPPDTFVDITDISTMAGLFGKTCAPCANDLDCDAISNASDNCPNWPNPAQTLPPWPIPANDPDCDGFSNAVEGSTGTAALVHCGANAWPADINSDGYSDITDITQLAGNFGKAVPPAPARQNIAPDPVDGFVDITDVSKMSGFFGKSCA